MESGEGCHRLSVSDFEGNPSDGKQVHQQTVFTPGGHDQPPGQRYLPVTLRAVNQAGLQGVDDVQTLRVQLTAEPAASSARLMER